MYDSPCTLSTGEKLKLLEEREQEKEKSAVHGSKAEKVMAEVEELKSKMRSIELEKTSLQSTVSYYCSIINIFYPCIKGYIFVMNHALVCSKETKSKNYIWMVYKALVRNLMKFILIFCQCRVKFNVHVKIPVL